MLLLYHIFYCRKLYYTHCINGYISKITISKLTVNGQLPAGGCTTSITSHQPHLCACVHHTSSRSKTRLQSSHSLKISRLLKLLIFPWLCCKIIQYQVHWISVKWKYHEISVRFWKYQYISVSICMCFLTVYSELFTTRGSIIYLSLCSIIIASWFNIWHLSDIHVNMLIIHYHHHQTIGQNKSI